MNGVEVIVDAINIIVLVSVLATVIPLYMAANGTRPLLLGYIAILSFAMVLTIVSAVAGDDAWHRLPASAVALVVLLAALNASRLH